MTDSINVRTEKVAQCLMSNARSQAFLKVVQFLQYSFITFRLVFLLSATYRLYCFSFAVQHAVD